MLKFNIGLCRTSNKLETGFYFRFLLKIPKVMKLLKHFFILFCSAIPILCYTQIDYFRVFEDLGSIPTLLEQSNGNYLMGATVYNPDTESNDILLSSIDSLTGEVISEQFFGSADLNETLISMNYTPDHSILVSGRTFEDNISSPYLAKLDTNLNLLWATIAPSFDNFSRSYSGIQLASGAIKLLLQRHFDKDTYLYTFSTDGVYESVDTLLFTVNQVIESSDNNLILIGAKKIDAQHSNIIVQKRTLDGLMIWEQVLGNNFGLDKGKTIIETLDKGFLLACENDEQFLDNPVSSQIIKIDSSGNYEYDVELLLGQPVHLSGNHELGYTLSSYYLFYEDFVNEQWRTVSYRLDNQGYPICSYSHESRLYEHWTNTITLSTGVSVLSTAERYGRESYLLKIGNHCNLITDDESVSIGKDINIFPNPLSKVLYLNNLPLEYKITLVDLLGNKIELQENIGETYEMNVNYLPKGIYFLIIESDEHQQTHKLVKH